MIRRKFLKHAPKEHNDEKVKKTLEKHNVPTFEGNEPSKFGQFGNVAKDLAAKSRKTFTTPDGGHVAPADKTFSWQQKALYGGGSSSHVKGDPHNPYAVAQPQGNPYSSNVNQTQPNSYTSAASSARQSAAGGANPYGSSQPHGSQPYANQPYGNQPDSSASFASKSSPPPQPYPLQSPPTSYGQPYGQSYGKPYESTTSLNQTQDELNQTRAATTPTSNYPPSSYASRNYSKPERFGEPLTRTQTNQSTASMATSAAARQELFGQAPRRINPDASEFDELNRTHTELEEEDELLATTRNLDRPQFTASMTSGMPTSYEPEDELNQLPSEFSQPAPLPTAPGGGAGQQLFEDSEDEDVDYVKREIRQTKQESVESTRRALQIAAEAETSGRNAMGMLGDQGERLGNSAKTVALGNVQARVGEQNAEELQRLNRSIFIPNVSNPFNSRRRNQLKEQRLKSEKDFDRLEREALENQQRLSEQRVADGLNSSGYGYSETALRAKQRMNRDNPERKMYQFEADSDDDALEDELDQNLDGISDAAKRLHGLSLKINGEVTDQNTRIEHMGGRVDDLDYRLHKSTARMATIN